MCIRDRLLIMQVAAKANGQQLKTSSIAPRHIEIMDTTLRDGEQTSGVSFSATEKLAIAQLLLTEVKVDRIEVASARVSEGEFEAVKAITKWAKANGFLNLSLIHISEPTRLLSIS